MEGLHRGLQEEVDPRPPGEPHREVGRGAHQGLEERVHVDHQGAGPQPEFAEDAERERRHLAVAEAEEVERGVAGGEEGVGGRAREGDLEPAVAQEDHVRPAGGSDRGRFEAPEIGGVLVVAEGAVLAIGHVGVVGIAPGVAGGVHGPGARRRIGQGHGGEAQPQEHGKVKAGPHGQNRKYRK